MTAAVGATHKSLDNAKALSVSAQCDGFTHRDSLILRRSCLLFCAGGNQMRKIQTTTTAAAWKKCSVKYVEIKPKKNNNKK